MKNLLKKTLLIVAVCVMSGCANGEDMSENLSQSIVISDQPINHENPRVDYTKDEVREIINNSGGFKASDKHFYASVPKSIDHVSEFYTGFSDPLPRQEALEEFSTVFEYLFPEKELNKEFLYYYAELPNDPKNTSQSLDDLPLTQGYYSSIHQQPIYDEKNYKSYINGTLGDERVNSYFFYDEGKHPNENPVAIMMRSPFGNDLCAFNKGQAHKFFKNENEKYFVTVLYFPQQEMELIKNLPPDSEEKYKLSGKEVSVKDAVKFFEDYISSIPCANESSAYGIHVNDVEVYKINDDNYYFSFNCSRIHDGIHFDYYDGKISVNSNESPDLSQGGMVRADDVNYAYETYRAQIIDKESAIDYSKVVPFGNAVKLAVDNMTNYVDFEVERAELIYTQDTGNSKFGEAIDKVSPKWKFLLHNPNDDRYYAVYVDALNGEVSVKR